MTAVEAHVPLIESRRQVLRYPYRNDDSDMAMTPEEKEARRAAREAKKAVEEAAEHEEFLRERESFHNSSPREALRLLARAERHTLLLHTKVTRGHHPRKDRPDAEYTLVQLWTGDDELGADLYVWDDPAETQFELRNRQWEFEGAVRDFERFEEAQNAELERQRKRRELLGRLSAEERELLGV